jgi:hypothetical protein
MDVSTVFCLSTSSQRPAFPSENSTKAAYLRISAILDVFYLKPLQRGAEKIHDEATPIHRATGGGAL